MVNYLHSKRWKLPVSFPFLGVFQTASISHTRYQSLTSAITSAFSMFCIHQLLHCLILLRGKEPKKRFFVIKDAPDSHKGCEGNLACLFKASQRGEGEVCTLCKLLLRDTFFLSSLLFLPCYFFLDFYRHQSEFIKINHISIFYHFMVKIQENIKILLFISINSSIGN